MSFQFSTVLLHKAYKKNYVEAIISYLPTVLKSRRRLSEQRKAEYIKQILNTLEGDNGRACFLNQLLKQKLYKRNSFAVT